MLVNLFGINFFLLVLISPMIVPRGLQDGGQG